MHRRAFIQGLGGILATGQHAALAQSNTRRVFRIGYLAVGSREQQLHLIAAFQDGLRRFGYAADDNVVIEFRFADGQLDRLQANADDLVRLGVDVIIVSNNANAMAAAKATSTIPIVMAAGVDPVGAGLVASLSRPGGNVTGFTQDTGGEINGKRLQLLKDTLPGLARVGVLWNPDFAPNESRLASLKEAGATLGLTLVPAEMRNLAGLDQAIALMRGDSVQAFVLLAEPVMFNSRHQIAARAITSRLPAISSGRDFADAGLLFSYGVDFQYLFRSIPIFIDRLFRGAKAADLPVEQPTKFELVINLKTAAAMGIAVPPLLLSQADQLIE